MMDIIKKIIPTDAFKNRIAVVKEEDGKELSYPSVNGKYGYDIEVNDSEVKVLLPIVDGNRLRFRDFRNIYYLVEDFRRTAKIYKKCLRGWQVSTDESDSVISEGMTYNIYASVDEIAETETDKVIIFHDADKLKNTIKSEASSLIKNIIAIRQFCIEHLIEQEDEKPSWALNPYISVPLFIDADTCEQGKIESILPQWEAGKEYEKGNIVIYDNECYIAKKDIQEKDNLDYPFNNETFWQHITEDKNIEEFTVTGTAESQLSIFLTKKLYIDDTFTKYPFYKDGDNICFPYLMGTVKNGNGFGRLTNIYCNGDDSRLMQGENFKQIIQNLPSNFSSVTFCYDIMDTVSGVTSNISWKNAVSYTETYAIETAETNGDEYFFIKSGETLNAAYSNSDAISNGKNRARADVKYTVEKKEYADDIKTVLNSFIKISPVGAQDIKTDIDAEIDRGKSAMFERMNILSEIKSLNDLENYRNNYFDI